MSFRGPSDVTHRSKLTCLAGLLWLIAACGSQQAAGYRTSLVTGTVLAGPVSPVARAGQPDTRPVAGATVEALRGTDIVARSRTDAGGRYELPLQPGSYVILAKSDQYRSKSQGETISVPEGETRTVNFVLDTGIR